MIIPFLLLLYPLEEKNKFSLIFHSEHDPEIKIVLIFTTKAFKSLFTFSGTEGRIFENALLKCSEVTITGPSVLCPQNISFKASTAASFTNAAKSAPVNEEQPSEVAISSRFTSGANFGEVPS